jgi:hypothetical protein
MLQKMRKAEFGVANDDELQVANDKCQMADDKSQIAVGQDCSLVWDDSTSDKNGTVSPESAHAAVEPEQHDGIGQCPSNNLTTFAKVQNKPSCEASQSPDPQLLTAEMAEAAGRKQSQSPAGENELGTAARPWPCAATTAPTHCSGLVTARSGRVVGPVG